MPNIRADLSVVIVEMVLAPQLPLCAKKHCLIGRACHLWVHLLLLLDSGRRSRLFLAFDCHRAAESRARIDRRPRRDQIGGDLSGSLDLDALRSLQVPAGFAVKITSRATTSASAFAVSPTMSRWHFTKIEPSMHGVRRRSSLVLTSRFVARSTRLEVAG